VRIVLDHKNAIWPTKKQMSSPPVLATWDIRSLKPEMHVKKIENRPSFVQEYAVDTWVTRPKVNVFSSSGEGKEWKEYENEHY